MAMIAAAAAVSSCALLARLYFGRARTCHFCNRDGSDRLPSAAVAAGSWYCPFDDCGQYNGFSADGDYDRPLPELADPAYSSRFSPCRTGPFLSAPPVLCSQCQCEQGLLVRAIAHAGTSAEAAAITRRYRLCSDCREAVNRRLQTVQRRTRLLSTPLQISDSMRGRVAAPVLSPLLTSLVVLTDVVLLWSILSTVFDVAQTPMAALVLSWVSQHEAAIVGVKLIASVIGVRRIKPHTLMSAVDVVLQLSMKGWLMPLPLPALICEANNIVCMYRHWTYIIRCLTLISLMIDGLRVKCRTNGRRKFATSTVRPSLQTATSAFDKAMFDSCIENLPVRNLNDRPQERKAVVSDSGFNFSQDQLHDDLLAMEGARSCAVEDLFAGISLSRSISDPSSPISSDRPGPSIFSSLSIACVFVVALILFIANTLWSHWLIGGLYTGSLLVMLAVGRRRLVTIPFTLLLVLRQCQCLHELWDAIYAFMAQFGLDLAALLLLGLSLLVDWAAVLDKLSSGRRTDAVSIPEA